MDASGRRNQKNFRSLLQSLSRPGRVVRLKAVDGMSPSAAAMAVAECLLDSEVSLCVVGNGVAPSLQASIARATGARAGPLGAADFVFVCGVRSRGGVREAKRGRPECPEEGATVVYGMDAQPVGVSERFRVRLAGPGIPGPAGIAPEMPGIPVEEWSELMTVNADYPLGVDAFFVRPSGEVMGLPRSTRIQVR